MVATACFLLVGCARDVGSAVRVQSTSAVERSAEPNEPSSRSRTDLLREEWGVRIERATLSAGGYMVDFRFRVLDVAKAAPILDRRARPYLIDQTTGAKFIVPIPPKVGQLRSGGAIREGAVYFIYFANPGRYIRSGNRVTVVVGDFEARDVLVQ
jgi:hypothetical protein